MSTRFDAFEHATNTAHHWLATIATALATDDRRYAYRTLRAWLHTLRDRMTVDSAAAFGAQLPELLRGVYYDGWQPGKAPVKYGVEGCLLRFAWEARIPVPDVPSTAAAVTGAMGGLLSPGRLDETLALLPKPLRRLFAGTAAPTPSTEAAEPESTGITPIEDLLADLQARVETLATAVRTLAQGFEDNPLTGPDNHQRARAARLAAEILMADRAAARSGADASTGAGVSAA